MEWDKRGGDSRSLLSGSAVHAAVRIVALRRGQVIIQHVVREVCEELLQLSQESHIRTMLPGTPETTHSGPAADA